MVSTENQIPGLDLVSNNENITKEFLNVSKIIPQNQNGPIQTPDDKPFNFPKSITNPTTIHQQSVNTIPPNNNSSQPPTSMYQNSPNWSNNKYNPVSYYNKNPSNIENASMPRFDPQIDINSQQQSYCRDSSNTTYNNSQNNSNVNYRKPLEGSYNTPSNETGTIYNKPPDEPSYNRNFNTSSSKFGCGYNQFNENTSNLNNFNRPSEKSNTSYQYSKPSLNTGHSKPSSLNTGHSKPPSLNMGHSNPPSLNTGHSKPPSLNMGHSKPPSLLSLNVMKPASLGKKNVYFRKQ